MSLPMWKLFLPQGSKIGDIRAIFSKLDKIEEATRDVKKSGNDFQASNANFCKSLGPVPVALFNCKPGLLRPHDSQKNLSASADPSSNQEQSCTSDDGDDWELRLGRSGRKRARQASQLASHPGQLPIHTQQSCDQAGFVVS